MTKADRNEGAERPLHGIAERRDEVLKRMLSTPPKPHKSNEKSGRQPKPAPQKK